MYLYWESSVFTFSNGDSFDYKSLQFQWIDQSLGWSLKEQEVENQTGKRKGVFLYERLVET